MEIKAFTKALRWRGSTLNIGAEKSHCQTWEIDVPGVGVLLPQVREGFCFPQYAEVQKEGAPRKGMTFPHSRQTPWLRSPCSTEPNSDLMRLTRRPVVNRTENKAPSRF